MDFDRMIKHLLPLDGLAKGVFYDEELRLPCAVAAMLLGEGMELSKIREFQETKDRKFWAEAMPYLARLGLSRPEAISSVMRADDEFLDPPSERLKRLIGWLEAWKLQMIEREAEAQAAASAITDNGSACMNDSSSPI